ncbi:transposase-like zinc-binding domain-containing protein [Actinobacillus minor]
MKYEKNCPFCFTSNIQKYGKKNNIQRYFFRPVIKHFPLRIN